MMYRRVHIVGPSGTGTSSVAAAVCASTGHVHLDTDGFFWLPTADPFTVKRGRDECHAHMANDFTRHERWILSGSVCGWAEQFNPLFDLVVYMYVPHGERMERLMKRELGRYGGATLESSSQREKIQSFLDWASGYETSTDSGRNLRNHIAWLGRLTCPIFHIVNDDFDDTVRIIADVVSHA